MDQHPKTVAFTTLGCKTNQFETASMVETLANDGFCIVPFEDKADIYVINTCTVTAKTDAESRRLIRRAVRQNPSARIAVTGCYAQVAFAELSGMAGVNLILGNREKKEISTLLKDIASGQKVVVSDLSELKVEEGSRLESFAEHTRAFLQVQNGCDSACSYCIVPTARGRSRSVPVEEVIQGIERFAAKGFREVVLTGIHLGAYGLDFVPPSSLHKLLERAEDLSLVERLRVGSVEPTEISPALINMLTTAGTICQHLHIPLQSGSDGVLRRMNRNYPAETFREVVLALKGNMPDICIGTDVITGFPGETDAEFEEGYRFLESLPLAYLHVFPFSPRPGTPATTMPAHLNGLVVKNRAARLRKLSERKKLAFHGSFLGRDLRVLVQGKEAQGELQGLSRNYIPVQLHGDADRINTEVTVKVTGVSGTQVMGEIID